ncbi:unnamed protein product [Calypogeia fissa]
MGFQSTIASPKTHCRVTPAKVIVGLVLFTLAIVFSKIAFNGTKVTNVANSFLLDHVSTNAMSIPQDFDGPVQDLIILLKTATAAAAPRPGSRESEGTPTEDELNAHDRLHWEEKNPCVSRKELKLRYKRRMSVEDVDPPSELQVVMDEYSKLHRACIQASGDLTTLFLSKNPETGCKFLIAEAGNGLGNRITWMVSNLMYAILTQRALLVDPRSLIPSLMCEPFLGSSWAAPTEFPFADLRPDLWQTTNDFLATMDNFKVYERNGTDAILVNAARADDNWGPVSQFYCPAEQSIYAKVRWITLGGCLYFLPGLFAIPTFQPVLQSIFKDKNPLTHLLRSSMLPQDLVWARTRRVEEVYLQNKHQMVGVHVRYHGGYDEYNDHHILVNSNVKGCLVENGILPKISHFSLWKLFTSTPKPSSGIAVLFISSLYDSLFDDYKIMYPQDKAISKISPVSQEAVSLVHLSSEGQQLPGFEIDSQALVEILCLSFSDVLLTSPVSTFSQVAQAYGGLKPWIISFEVQAEKHSPACQKGKSTDGCYQGGGLIYNCPNDPSVDKLQIMKHVSSLRPCEDGSSGVQIIPD